MAELFSTTFPGSTLPGTMSSDHRLGGSHTVSGGNLTLTTAATAESYAIARQTTAVAMADGDTATVRFVSTTGSGVVAFSLRTNAADGTFIPSVSVNGGGNWFARVFRTSTGPGASLGTAGASATTSPWLRFRRSGTSCIAETAPDAAGSPGTWTTLYTWLAAETGQWTSSFTTVQLEVAAYSNAAINSAVISRLGVSSLLATDLQLRFTAGAATVDSAVMPVAAGGGGGGGSLLFAADWGTATGNSSTACTDGGYFDSVTGTFVPLSVVTAASTPAAFSRTPNVLRITQRGSTISATMERTAAIPLNADIYGEFFVLNGGNTSIHNHPIVHNTFGGFQCIPFGLTANASAWTPFINPQYNSSGGAIGYPREIFAIGQVGTAGVATLAHNTWYRFRWRIQTISAGAAGGLSTYRIFPQVYSYNNATPNTLGTLLYDASSYFQQDTTGAAGQTLQAWYDAGNSFGAVNSTLMRNIGVGQEGAAGATDTGLHWYVADMTIRDTGWAD
jgi:hypothetical protein